MSDDVNEGFDKTNGRRISSYTYHEKTNSIFALCVDGTLWNYNIENELWNKVPEIPKNE